MIFAAKKTCTICGEKHKAKEMFVLEADSPLLIGVADPGSVILCNGCNFSYHYIYDQKYKKDSIENAYKFFKSQDIQFVVRQSNDVLRNYRKLLDDRMGGYPDYLAFQKAMKELYSPAEGGSIVTGYFAVNKEKGCFSIIRNEHIGLPRNAENLEDVSLVEDGDEKYVKKCDLIFIYNSKEEKSDIINMFSTTGISRTSTIYKETMDTYNEIKGLADKLK
ncbi:MAG: hypothetical protein MJ092_03900 [Lachnospiraceae bacterium]|nr:hypothetical protein [Lachnospiraceae bacterium]